MTTTITANTLDAPHAEQAYQHLLAQLKTALAQGLLHTNVRLVGIHSGGAWIAQRLYADLGLQSSGGMPGLLDISFYRDDFDQKGLHTQVKPTQIQFEIAGSHLLLIDDVMYTGRTVRAALHELYDYGRPASVQLAVLLDRGGRQLPFQPNYVGLQVQATSDQTIVLSLQEGTPTMQFNLQVQAAWYGTSGHQSVPTNTLSDTNTT